MCTDLQQPFKRGIRQDDLPQGGDGSERRDRLHTNDLHVNYTIACDCWDGGTLLTGPGPHWRSAYIIPVNAALVGKNEEELYSKTFGE